MDGKYIAAQIRRLRKEADLTVEEVGTGVNRSGKTVSAWETGRNVPSAEMLIDICRFFNVSIETFYPPEVTYAYVNMGEPESKPSELLGDVRELVDLYGGMTDEGRRQLMIYARGLAATYPKNQVDKATA